MFVFSPVCIEGGKEESAPLSAVNYISALGTRPQCGDGGFSFDLECFIQSAICKF